MCLNGAAARLVHPGDRIIVISYADYDQAELDGFEPAIVHVDRANRAIAEELAQIQAQVDA
jgi:aspartate 1-decarboxylase